MKNIDINFCAAFVEAHTAKNLRFETAYKQGQSDALQGKPSVKPFGDIARAGYSAGYSAGIESMLTTLKV